MPKVSVVIPTYNRAELLRECLESIMAQSFFDFEIIVVDDGSTDNTREVVSSFPAKYVYQENQGSPGARNTGIEMAEGEYILFIDSDDILLEDALRMEVDVLDRHPEVALSYSQSYHMDKDGRILTLFKPPCRHSCIRDGKEEIKDLIFNTHISAPVVRRWCLDEVGMFDPAFKQGSVDLELWVRLAKRYTFAYIAKPLMKYRIHEETITAQRSLEEIEKSKGAILESIFNDAQQGKTFSHLRAKAYFNLYMVLSGAACTRRNMKISRTYLLKAAKTYPKGLFKGMGIPWVFQFSKTLVPLPILDFGRSCKRSLKIFASHRFQRLQ